MPLPAAAMRRGICKQNETEQEKKEFVYERICVIGGDLKRKSANSKKKKKEKSAEGHRPTLGEQMLQRVRKNSQCVCVCLFCVGENFAREMELH